MGFQLESHGNGVMSENGDPDISMLLDVIRKEMQAASLKELAMVVGSLEQLKFLAYTRLVQKAEVENDLLLTIKEVAGRLKISEYRAYELARQGTLKSVRLGKSVRVKSAALMEYLERHGG